ncbi:Bug family tripartite tricarboxylate transporter substrate binding protein [Paraburkholderia sp.]|uniref:Bug family tripartite tricarboxylate transporter substrate binding protein n=1 Tax=Paraburkholderia sp. TaxID=1926495 RepID=UPI0039E3309B
MMRRRRFVAALGAPVLLGWMRVALAAFPDNPIRLVVGFPGGSGEAQARIVAKTLGQILGQPVIVQGQGGAGGNIATAYVAKSRPDGYTMLLGVSTFFEINPLIYRTPGFKNSDLRPVSLLSEQEFVLTVRPQLPIHSVKELIDYARANPNKLTNATGGLGSPLDLCTREFMSRTGVKILSVPYKGGGEDTLALLSGFADMMFGSVTDVTGNLESGKLRALGVTGIKRLKNFPDVPTIAEAGVPGYNVTIWTCLSVPAATPADVVARLQDASAKAIADPACRASLEQMGLFPLHLDGDAVQRRIELEVPMWREIFRKAGVEPT